MTARGRCPLASPAEVRLGKRPRFVDDYRAISEALRIQLEW
jgi:hypothetical protein